MNFGEKHLEEFKIESKTSQFLNYLQLQGLEKDTILDSESCIFQQVQNNKDHLLWMVLNNALESNKEGFLTPKTNRTLYRKLNVEEFVQELVYLLKLYHCKISHHFRIQQSLKVRIDEIQKFSSIQNIMAQETDSLSLILIKVEDQQNQNNELFKYLCDDCELGSLINIHSPEQQITIKQFGRIGDNEISLISTSTISLIDDVVSNWDLKGQIEFMVEFDDHRPLMIFKQSSYIKFGALLSLTKETHSILLHNLTDHLQNKLECSLSKIKKYLSMINEILLPFKDHKDCIYIVGSGFEENQSQKLSRCCCIIY